MYNRIVDFLKAEYDEAKVECQYYAELINKQDASFNVYFAIFFNSNDVNLQYYSNK